MSHLRISVGVLFWSCTILLEYGIIHFLGGTGVVSVRLNPMIHEWKKCTDGGFWIEHTQYELEAYAYCFPFSSSCRILQDPYLSALVSESPIFIIISSVIWPLFGILSIDLISRKCWIIFNLMLRRETFFFLLQCVYYESLLSCTSHHKMKI